MINKIFIENFKSIKKIDLELQSINILIGANGAGKSNFIGFFKLVYNLYHQNLQNYIAEQAGAENVLYLGLKHAESLNVWKATYRILCRQLNQAIASLFQTLLGTKWKHGCLPMLKLDLIWKKRKLLMRY